MWRPLDTEAPTMERSLLKGAYRRDPAAGYPITAPVITAASRSFTAPMAVSMHTLAPTDPIFYTVDGTTPGLHSLPYRSPITIGSSTVVKAVAMRGGRTGAVSTAQYLRLDPDRTIEVESHWSPQYDAGGRIALIDGIRGPKDWRTGGWQGYRNTDVLATVDLGGVKQLKRLGLGVLQDEKSWIWNPGTVQFAWSTNGRNWSSTTVANTVPRETKGTLITGLMTEVLDKRARYIKLIATNAGPAPEGHPGAGETTWIFVDELLIECE